MPKTGYTGDFEKFWKIYPRRVEKMHAFKMWERALKFSDAAAILLGAQRYADWCRAAQREDQYIAHPGTWLSRGRWDDELKAPQGKNGTLFAPEPKYSDAYYAAFSQWRAAGERGPQPRPEQYPKARVLQ